jgi:hypothetical protein
MEVSNQVPHRTTYGQNNSWVVQETPAEWLRNEEAGQGHWLRLSSACEKLLSRALQSQHIAQAGNCRHLSQVSGAFFANVFTRKDTGCNCYRCCILRITIFISSSAWISNSGYGQTGLLRSWFSVTRQRFMCVVRWTNTTHAFGARKLHMQQWNTSVIHLKWMSFLLFPFAKSMDHTSLQSQLLPVKLASMSWHVLPKQTWRDSLPIDMLLLLCLFWLLRCRVQKFWRDLQIRLYYYCYYFILFLWWNYYLSTDSMLHLSTLTSKLYSITMIVTDNLQTFHTQCVVMCMIPLHTKSCLTHCHNPPPPPQKVKLSL